MQAAINKFTSATADANGNITLSFPENPGQGMQWQVNVNVMNSPSAAIWTLTVGFQQVGNWTGSAPFGPVKVINQDTVTITGTGLQQGFTAYAQITGWADEDDGSIIIPNNVPNTSINVETVVKVINGKTVQSAGTTIAPVVFTPPANARRCTIVMSFALVSGSETFSITGNTTNLVYVTANISSGQSKYDLVIEPLLDPTYKIQISGMSANSQVTIWVLASQTNAISESLPTPQSVTPIPYGKLITNFSSWTQSANGTFLAVLKPAAPLNIYINTVYIEQYGAGSTSVDGKQSGFHLLSLASAGTFGLYYAGLQIAEELDIVTSNFVAGSISVVGITYAVA